MRVGASGAVISPERPISTWTEAGAPVLVGECTKRKLLLEA